MVSRELKSCKYIHQISTDFLLKSLFSFVWSIQVPTEIVPRQYLCWNLSHWSFFYDFERSKCVKNVRPWIAARFQITKHPKLIMKRNDCLYVQLLEIRGNNKMKTSFLCEWKLHCSRVFPFDKTSRSETNSKSFRFRFRIRMTVPLKPFCLKRSSPFSPQIFWQDLIGYWSTNQVVKINVFCSMGNIFFPSNQYSFHKFLKTSISNT